jgi:nitronate monooxygenase
VARRQKLYEIGAGTSEIRRWLIGRELFAGIAMSLRTKPPRSLGLRVPIIQAPMAGGPSSQELVAACSAAGALGCFGFAYTQPAEMEKQAAWVRSQTALPFLVNLFSSPQPGEIAAAAQRPALDAVAHYYAEFGMPAPEPVKPPYAPDFEAQLTAVERIRPKAFTSHLAALPPERLKKLQSMGVLIGGSATNIAEAKELESLGVDFIIAQGGEAGGHRGTWLRDPYDALTGTLALARLIVREVRVPVVATGGIMDGAGIAAVLALARAGRQLGTAFIPCPESGASPVHKRRARGAEDDTRITEKFSGKPARGPSTASSRKWRKRRSFPFRPRTASPGAAPGLRQGGQARLHRDVGRPGGLAQRRRRS